MGGTPRDALTASTRHKYRFCYTFSTHSDRFAPRLMCVLTRPPSTEGEPPIMSILLRTLVAAQDASYTFTTITVPNALGTVAYDINNHGQVVGPYLASR
jgi:hypothetical protein